MQNARDASGDRALPVRTHQCVETRLSPVLLANLSKRVRASVCDLIGIKAIAEVGYLDDDWDAIGALKARSVDGVLIGAGNVVLFCADVVRQHGYTSGRRSRNYPSDSARARQILDADGAIEIVDQRPSPHVSEPCQRRGIFGCHDRPRGSADDLRESCSNRLIRVHLVSSSIIPNLINQSTPISSKSKP